MSNMNNLSKHNFQFTKRFGQNFIFDQNLLQAICNDAGITNQTSVLEIGAGSGTLTKVLSQNAKNVLTYEIDNNLKPVLEDTLKDSTNVEVMFGDILKQNTSAVEEKIGEPYVMVANLPYYITTPILFKFVDESTMLTKMVVMVQKEVAERLVAKHNTKDYGIITVLLQAVANLSISRIVKRNMFTPAPNVDSAIVVIEFIKNKFHIKDFELFKKVVKCAFAMRRKTLANNLKSTFSFSQETINVLLQELNLTPAVRGEVLSVEQFVNLSNAINKLQAK